MKLEVGRNELLSSLQSVIGVVERRQTLPVLSNLLLDVGEEDLVVTGTDLELEMVSRARVRTVQPGKTTIPARKLYDICRGLPEGAEITIDASADKAILKSGRSRFTLATLRAEEFPAFGIAEGGQSLTMSQKVLRRLIDRTQFAMAAQDVRYYLNGLLLHISPKRVRAVATDGHRLAMSEVMMDTGFSDDLQVILPRKTVLELQRLLESSDETVQMRIGDGQFQADVDTIRLTSKLIDGRFPDYERVVPEGGDKRLTANRERMRQALGRAAILANEKFRGVRLQLEDNKLSLQTHNPEHEEAEEELEVDYSGAPLEIGFNVVYLLDALGVMDTDDFIMDLKSADSSGLIQESSDGDSRYVVMPMRL
ncbi:MAG: DNA polymerase III subunit beta [Pseudomonadota bacterium]|jgi:DNA polymerase III subunit beta|nr:DNA polymerase III subunit beta [Pseudomonadota bacterium]